jgi:hypothetical protein
MFSIAIGRRLPGSLGNAPPRSGPVDNRGVLRGGGVVPSHRCTITAAGGSWWRRRFRLRSSFVKRVAVPLSFPSAMKDLEARPIFHRTVRRVRNCPAIIKVAAKV